MRIELRGLELHGFHGALDWERDRGQRFVFDVELEVGEAGASDRLEDAVDYRDVAACVREVSDGRAFRLLEALATALADELMARFPAERVEHNLELLRRLDVLVGLGRPVLVGVSRKRMLGRILGDPDAVTGSAAASVGAAVAAFERGASIFRVHDVREHVEALALAAAVSA